MGKKLIQFMVITGILIMFFGTAGAEPVKIKFATFEPPQAFILSKIFMPWIEKVNKDSEGSLKIEIYPGGTLGRDPRVQLKLVTDGVADIAWVMNSYQPGRFADDLVVNIPFTTKTSYEGSLAIYRMYKNGLLRGYDDFVVVGLFAHGQYSFHTNYLVNSVSDLKGKKIRTAGKIHHAMVEALGATPVAMSITKTAENISRGVVHGTLSNLDAITTFRIGDVAQYHCMVPLGTVTVMLAMNKKTYESLSAKARAAIDNNILPLIKSYGKKMDKHDQTILEKWKKDQKHKVVTVTGNKLNPWKKAVGPAIAAWKKNTENAETLLKAYTGEISKIKAGQ